MSGQGHQPILEIDGITKRYGQRTVLNEVHLVVLEQDFLVVYGPPASGKSVLMRILMGLEHPTSGSIRMRGEEITALPAAERNIGYVPQSFALYPHINVYDNIAYPLKLAKTAKSEIDPIVQRAAEMLKIVNLLQKRPDQLSGGQKQRVAIARGIAKRTDFFVLDDPLAGLDFKLREQLVDDLRQLQVTTNVTFLYSTSDAIETLSLADTVAVLDSGRIVEIGAPEELYARPTQMASAQLLGFPQANFIRGRIANRDGHIWCKAGPFEFPAKVADGWNGDEVVVGLRPEAIDLGNGLDPNGSRLRVPATITLREDLGGEEIVYLSTGGESLVTVVRHDDEAHRNDDVTTIMVDLRDLVVFAPDGGRIGQGVTAHG